MKRSNDLREENYNQRCRIINTSGKLRVRSTIKCHEQIHCYSKITTVIINNKLLLLLINFIYPVDICYYFIAIL